MVPEKENGLPILVQVNDTLVIFRNFVFTPSRKFIKPLNSTKAPKTARPFTRRPTARLPTGPEDGFPSEEV